jgi:hypothetical protein|tara:strand:- start:118 stop:360 length:243 start_codon:yes stop_codon:yes gene_type:complete
MARDFLNGLKEGNRMFGEDIASVINFILLTFVYLFGVGITSMIAKLSGKNFLEIKNFNKDSYWSKLDLDKREKGEYYRQF